MSGSGCCGGGGCCGSKGSDAIGRRDFLKAAAVTAGGLAALGSGGFSAAETAATDDALRAWTANLWKRGERRVYRAAELEHIAVPLGGIGAGQVYLMGDGRLDSWQICNNFNTGAHVPGAFFGVWARQEGAEPVARLLQQGDADDMPGVTAVEFSGEFPYAWIDYLDGRLPVEVSLEAHTPFIPFNAADSGLPAGLFRFTLRNRTNAPVEASILASMPNLVGWDGYTRYEGMAHSGHCGNSNTLAFQDGRYVLTMAAQPGELDSLSQPRILHINEMGTAALLRLCGNLDLNASETLPTPEDAATSVYWLGAGNGLEAGLPAAFYAMQAGAGVVFAGSVGLVGLVEPVGGDAKDYVTFEDWERGNYDGWTIEGACFGEEPASGTLANQQAVSGWRGKRFVNTFVNGDGSTGRAVSEPFEIGKKYIHLQVGGGKHPGETCVNLRVGNDVVHSATGENSEQLRAVRWDVSKYVGQTAVIEIVDNQTGGWGHVLVGDILFSDEPSFPLADAALSARIREALPFTWSGSQVTEAPAPINLESPLMQGLKLSDLTVDGYRTLTDFQLKPGARVLLSAQDGAPLVVAGPCGQGIAVVVNGRVLEAFPPGERKIVAGRLVAEAGKVEYASQTGWPADGVYNGTMALAVLPDDQEIGLTSCPQWDDLNALLADFADDGRIDVSNRDAAGIGRTWAGALSASVRLEPGQERNVTFALAWHFPNRMRDERYGWGPKRYTYDHRLGNHYNNRFRSASEVVSYLVSERQRLDAATREFHRALYDSTLPRWLLDAVTANIANLRSPIFVWIEDGFFGGFEGADNCCPMNCTHVYNYVMTTAYLFPELEQKTREVDLLIQMNPEKHFIPHRTVLPLSLPRLGDEIGGPHHHAFDGELGTILKTCREWRHTGDMEWLRTVWPNAKRVMEHVLRDHDVDGTGVIKGEQPNTYDTHLFGSNTFIGTLYLATLRATEEMAKAMGDDAFAGTCRARFDSGIAGYDKTCWNGEYYENVFDAPNATPETYNDNNCYGPGCFSDQLFGQWWAYLLNLGYVLPAEHVRDTLQATFKYNWRSDLTNHVHTQRVFAEGSEKGLLMGTWPRGGRPERPILYCDEVWTGIEYHVAASLIIEGDVEKGLQIAKGVRDRYTGNQRNPFAEVECGHHYARALSSYTMLNALAGYDYDGPNGAMTFAPRIDADPFECFFTAGQGWGTIRRGSTASAPGVKVSVAYGRVPLKTLRVKLREDATATKGQARIGRQPVACDVARNGDLYEITFEEGLIVEAEKPLEIALVSA